MAKREPIRDIQPRRRSIRDITPDAKRTRASERNRTDDAADDAAPSSRRRTRLPAGARVGMWGFFTLILLVAGFAMFLLFSGASVSVYPRSATVFVDAVYTAAAEAGDGDVTYETMTITEVRETTVEARGSKEVTERASGRITIYNDYSAASMRLIANTRFEAPDGKIYRMREPVTVPGVSGGEPGSVVITVFAEETGPAYNLSGTARFSVPGLTGTPQYSDVWAELTEDITGGFSGVRFSVEEGTERIARERLRDELERTLQDTARGQVPDGFLFYPETMNIRFTTLSDVPADEGKATLREEGTLAAVLIPMRELAEIIAYDTVGDYEGEEIMLPEPDALTFTLAEPLTYTPASGAPFDFNLSGTVDLLWTFNAERLAADLAGKPTNELQSVLVGYPGIERAEAVIRPFWQRTFPASAEDIRIIERRSS